MTKKQFCQRLAERCGISNELAVKVFEGHEDLVMEVIATEDYVPFSWGRIYGYFKDPMKLAPKIAEIFPGVAERGGWTLGKSGMPGIQWSTAAKLYTPVDPTELYCEDESVKYTSKARAYRQDRKLPEISEYVGLTEDEIQSLMKVADEKRYGKKTKTQLQQEAKERMDKLKASIKRNDQIRKEWIEEKVSTGVMTVADAKAVPITTILEERRKEWQDSIAKFEQYKRICEEKGIEYNIKETLNPYEIYKSDSMANFYMKMMEEGMTDEEVLEAMKKDMEELAEKSIKDTYETHDFDAEYSRRRKGRRVDKDGKPLEDWQFYDNIRNATSLSDSKVDTEDGKSKSDIFAELHGAEITEGVEGVTFKDKFKPEKKEDGFDEGSFKEIIPEPEDEFNLNKDGTRGRGRPKKEDKLITLAEKGKLLKEEQLRRILETDSADKVKLAKELGETYQEVIEKEQAKKDYIDQKRQDINDDTMAQKIVNEAIDEGESKVENESEEEIKEIKKGGPPETFAEELRRIETIMRFSNVHL